MLIKFGSIVVGGRGKLGGQVYSHNRGGDYVRNNATPSNPQSVYQMEQRAALTQFSQGWSGLTQNQRNAWNAAVANFPRTNVFGDQKQMSGKNLYTSLNRELLLTGQALLTSPPEPMAIENPTSFETLTAQQGGTFNIEVNGTTDAVVLVTRATSPVSAGTSFVKNRLRVVTTTAGTADSTTYALTTAYPNRFSPYMGGQKIFVEVYAVNAAGQRSPAIKDFLIVADPA